MLSEISQRQKDNYCEISPIHEIYIIKLIESRLMVYIGLGVGEMGRCWSEGTKSIMQDE